MVGMLWVVTPFWAREDNEINVVAFWVAVVVTFLVDDVVAFLVEVVVFLEETVLETCLAEETIVFFEDVLVFLLEMVEVLTGVLIFMVAKEITAGVLDFLEVLLNFLDVVLIFLDVVLVFLEDVLDFLREEELDFKTDWDTYLTVVWLVAFEEEVDTLLEAVPPATRVGDWLAGR
jgi:hypothetical protein